jgi:hypothetical protein
MRLYKRPLFYALYLFLLVAACFLSFVEGAEAATYNFYFNNTEQGPNSTAAPNVTIQDGKMVKPGGTGASQEPLPAVPANGTSVAAPPSVEEDASEARWKLSLGTIHTTYVDKVDPSGGSYSYSRPIGSITYYVTRELGISLLLGHLLGSELEVNPFGVRREGRRLQFGFTAGVLKDTVGYEGPNDDWYTGFSYGETKPTKLFLGAQAGINLVRNVALNVAYRAAPLEKAGHTTNALEWSLNYLF